MEVIQKVTDQSCGSDKVEKAIIKTEEENQHENNTTTDCNNVGSQDFIMDEFEKNKVSKLRDLCQIKDPSSDHQGMDDLTLRRFLRAREMDLEKASNMFIKYQKWRRSFMPEGSISESQIQNEIAQNKFFMQGLDNSGRPIAVLLASRHKQAKSLDEFKRYAVYCLEKVCSRMPRGHEKFVVIGDLKGWGYSNMDIRGYLASLSIWQDFYPERITKIFIVHAPYIFMAVWKIIYPFIDDKTKNKFVFVETENLKSALLSEIDECQLPVEYGGKLPLIPIQEC